MDGQSSAGSGFDAGSESRAIAGAGDASGAPPGFDFDFDFDRLRANLDETRARIAAAADRAGRSAADVTLVAVTKRRPSSWARGLVAAGVRDLGENYPQELWAKADELDDLRGRIRWHLIGHLQSNKARRTLAAARVIHGVDSIKLLRTLATLADEIRLGTGSDPSGREAGGWSVCLQVNTSSEASKHGWSPEGLLADAEAVAEIAGASAALRVSGLMTMAALGTSGESARSSFVALRELRDALRARTGLLLPELSMGMSGDYEVAVEEGATMVRVGSALFEGLEASE